MQVDRLVACPHCKSDSGIEVNDYGNTLRYSITFKTGEREVTEIFSTRPAPKFGKCIECGKRVKIKDVENR
jgi:hypothetical protein